MTLSLFSFTSFGSDIVPYCNDRIPSPGTHSDYKEFLAAVKTTEFSDQDIKTFPEHFKGAAQTAIAIGDYESVGALLLNAAHSTDSLNFYLSIADNVPANIPILFYGIDYQKQMLQEIGILNQKKRPNIFFTEHYHEQITETAGSFAEWSQDHIPQPVWAVGPQGEKTFKLVSANYRWNYSAPDDIARLSSGIHHHINNFMDWGNAVIDPEKKILFVVGDNQKKGDRLPVDLDLRELSALGVRKVIQLPHLNELENGASYKLSIGHADERMIFVDKNFILTDTHHYARFFRSLGYKVGLLPRHQGEKTKYLSYTNARLLNIKNENGSTLKLAFVPVFGSTDFENWYSPIRNNFTYDDQKAVRMYRNAGYSVIPVSIPLTACYGHGGNHCMSKTFPQIEGGHMNNFKRLFGR